MAQLQDEACLGSKSQHVVAIDLVRFVAAFFVLLTHLAFDIAERDDSPSFILSAGSIKSSYWPQLSFYGWIGVQIFFVISGIVIAYLARGADFYSFFRGRFCALCRWRGSVQR